MSQVKVCDTNKEGRREERAMTEHVEGETSRKVKVCEKKSGKRVEGQRVNKKKEKKGKGLRHDIREKKKEKSKD